MSTKYMILMVSITVVIVIGFFPIHVCAEESNLDEASYTFWEKPYIHPRIIEDLTSWVSDTGDQVVAINLKDSQDSNRYFGNIKVQTFGGDTPYTFISCKEVKGWCGYQYIGKTTSGIHILRTSKNTGGTGIFSGLLLVTIEEDFGITLDKNSNTVNMDRRRILVKKLGSIGLGDRYKGKIELKEDILFIAKDVGKFAAKTAKDRVIKINLDR